MAAPLHLSWSPRPRREALTSGALAPVSALVLAGGRSSRFGSDKLEVYVGGQPLLRYALQATAAACQEVLVVAAPDEASPGSHLLTTPLTANLGPQVRVVYDEEAFGGPLLGALAGLRAARHPLRLVVGGDMPLLRPELLAHLLAIARADAVLPARSIALRLDGAVQPLPMVLRRDATPVVAALVRAGRRALRDLLEAIPLHVLEPEEWLRYDPEGISFVDVDRIEDLVHWSARLEGSPAR